MSDYPMLISNKLHSFRNFTTQSYYIFLKWYITFLHLVLRRLCDRTEHAITTMTFYL